VSYPYLADLTPLNRATILINMTLLAFDWSVFAVKAGQFILSFSILVVLHELGHFLPARWFGCRVEKFYLFFNPWFSLAKKKIGETEYGLGWIPFGGYVKISGMVDESMDKEQMKQPAQPWEFRSKPAWQRLIIMLGGVTVNVILAILIFIAIAWVWGDEYLPPKNVKYGIATDSLGKSMGLMDGDIVYKVGSEVVKDEFKATAQILTTDAKSIVVLRDGREITLPVPSSMMKSLSKTKGLDFISIRFPGIVAGFGKESNAEKAGLKKGDKLIGVDSVYTPFFQDFQREIRKRTNSKANIHIVRGNDTLRVAVPVNEKGFIGVAPEGKLDKLGLKTEVRKYSFVESIPAGLERCRKTLSNYITGLKQIFSGRVDPKDSLGSVISIGSVFPGVWDWEAFWTLTAIFSIILAFMNVLPIPALDGGHALFTIYEMITGRKPSDKFMEYAQMVGMFLLLGLMAYALGLDIWRLFK
jgi:regulator of sigma E protease